MTVKQHLSKVGQIATKTSRLYRTRETQLGFIGLSYVNSDRGFKRLNNWQILEQYQNQ